MTQDKPVLYDPSIFDGLNFDTSLTDNGKYPEFCQQAIGDNSLFNSFRRNQVYNFALEHDSQDQGLHYLEIAKKLNLFESYIEEFKKNDTVGNPIKFHYDQIGEISPTTIRYIKVLKDLEDEFGTLNNLNICEIGVGYGGLCRIIDSYFRSVKSYCLVDLQPVLGLTQKYLNHFQINTSISYKTAEDLSVEDKYDLVISNYAFTELRREVQDIYLQKIILNSQKGYITYNKIDDFLNFNGYSVDELIEIIPHAKILDEIEITNPGDCIIVWSNN